MEGRVGICVNMCEKDSDCQGLMKCCSNGCGRQCMMPQGNKNSTCENKQKEALKTFAMQHSLMLQGVPMSAKPVLIPRCTAQGDFEAVQCKVPYGVCWCVNVKTGEMMANTMTRGKPNCPRPDASKVISSVCPAGVAVHSCNPLMCAKAKCRAYPTAHCHINPCGEKCTVEFYNDDNEKVDCYEGLQTCVKHHDHAMYKVKKMLPMPDPTVLHNITVHYILRPDKVKSNITTMMKQKLISHTKACYQPLEVGMECEEGELSRRYYFNKDTGSCEQFVFAGCRGNKNNFQTLKECEQMCDPHVCHMSKDVGTCTNFQRRWYFDKSAGSCKQFDYGGCNGNSNNFESQDTCMKCESPKMYGLYVPQCQQEYPGTEGFKYKQCLHKLCWCLDDQRQPIHASLTHGHLTCSAAGRVAAESDAPLACKSGKAPKVCHLTCHNTTCYVSGKKEGLVCSADPCDDCATTFYKPGATAGSWEKVQCDKEEDVPKPPETACKNGIALCEQSCATATCSGFKEALCIQDPCTCEVKFIDFATRTPVSCDRIAGLCERQRVEFTVQAQTSNSVATPTCVGAVFAPKQCHSEECWCVDDGGVELTGTRKASDHSITCEMNLAKQARVTVKVQANCAVVLQKRETFMWNFKYALAKTLNTEMKYITIADMRCGSVIVDNVIKAKANEDLRSTLSYLKSQILLGNMTMEHDGVVLKFEKDISISLDYTDAPAPTTAAPPSDTVTQQTIIIAVVGGVIGLMLIVAVVLAVIKSSPSRKNEKYRQQDPESYVNNAYGTYPGNRLPQKNGHLIL